MKLTSLASAKISGSWPMTVGNQKPNQVAVLPAAAVLDVMSLLG